MLNVCLLQASWFQHWSHSLLLHCWTLRVRKQGSWCVHWRSRSPQPHAQSNHRLNQPNTPQSYRSITYKLIDECRSVVRTKPSLLSWSSPQGLTISTLRHYEARPLWRVCETPSARSRPKWANASTTSAWGLLLLSALNQFWLYLLDWWMN